MGNPAHEWPRGTALRFVIHRAASRGLARLGLLCPVIGHCCRRGPPPSVTLFVPGDAPYAVTHPAGRALRHSPLAPPPRGIPADHWLTVPLLLLAVPCCPSVQSPSSIGRLARGGGDDAYSATPIGCADRKRRACRPVARRPLAEPRLNPARERRAGLRRCLCARAAAGGRGRRYRERGGCRRGRAPGRVPGRLPRVQALEPSRARPEGPEQPGPAWARGWARPGAGTGSAVPRCAERPGGAVGCRSPAGGARGRAGTGPGSVPSVSTGALVTEPNSSGFPPIRSPRGSARSEAPAGSRAHRRGGRRPGGGESERPVLAAPGPPARAGGTRWSGEGQERVRPPRCAKWKRCCVRQSRQR